METFASAENECFQCHSGTIFTFLTFLTGHMRVICLKVFHSLMRHLVSRQYKEVPAVVYVDVTCVCLINVPVSLYEKVTVFWGMMP